jgi:hypothetical protein
VTTEAAKTAWEGTKSAWEKAAPLREKVSENEVGVYKLNPVYP